MWLILPSGDPPRSDSDPAAGRAVSASSDASTAGTKIRTRAFMKFLLPLASPDRYSLGSLFTRLDGRNQEGSVKALSSWPGAYSVPDRRRRRGQVDALGHLHWHRGGRWRDDRGGAPGRRGGW